MSRVIGYGLFLHQCYKLSIHVQRYTFPVVKYKYDTGILLGEVIQWYNYLSAYRILSIHIFIFFLGT
jgi:hypothetical protein